MQSGGTTPSSRFGRLTWTIVTVGVLLAGGFTVYALTRVARPRITWLSPGDTNPAWSSEPAPFVRFKSEYLSLIKPVWRRVATKIPTPQLVERGMILSEEAAKKALPRLEATTNGLGQRAWILSAEQLREFQMRLEGDPGARILLQPSYSAALRPDFKEEIESGAIYIRDRSPGRPTRNFVLKKLSHAFQVHINEYWVRRVDPQPDPNQITLNAVMPEESSLLVDSGIAGPGRSERYWFIFTPGMP
jgi:hypothetical protein